MTIIPVPWALALVRFARHPLFVLLELQIDRLFQAARTNQSDLAAQLCSELKSTAGTFGYAPISDVTRELLALLTNGAALESLQPKIDAIQRLCARACMAYNPSQD